MTGPPFGSAIGQDEGSSGERASGTDVRPTAGMLLPALILWALFLSTSFVRAPIPAVNEPHYLGKARSVWNPDWCPGDFFLESSNPHLVFYWTIGWLTKWLTLAQTAAVARAASFALLAAAWTLFSRELFRSRWTGLLAACLFNLLMAFGNFSGEWLIGGVESKVFSYAFVFFAAAAWFRARPVLAAGLTVAAVAYHPVAGLWTVIAAGMVAVDYLWRGRKSSGSKDASQIDRQVLAVDQETSTRDISTRTLSTAAMVLTVGTVAAIAPALPVVLGSAPEIGRQADRLLLTQRVGHHTDPLLFLDSSYLYYGVLLGVWLGAWFVSSPGPPLRLVQRFVAASLVIAAVGLFIGWLPEFSSVDRLHPLRLWLLKFYPFRLADLALPAGIALWIGYWCDRPAQGEVSPARSWRLGSLAALAWIVALLLPAPDANPSGMTERVYDDWITVCRWLRDHTPTDALIATSNEDWAIKWYADRPEYVSFKDCPQDAAGIVEWWRRRQGLVHWSRQSKADGVISAADLDELHRQTGIDYLVVSRYGPFDVSPVFEFGPFKVYPVRLEPSPENRRRTTPPAGP
ncbi:MAG: hypothetical protein KDA75_17190 [Planctomycetaceae bacterium]|nr:hypothetical protein [Planctomycetaceae bacterium]